MGVGSSQSTDITYQTSSIAPFINPLLRTPVITGATFDASVPVAAVTIDVKSWV